MAQLLARSKPRERAEVEGSMWHEYRLREVSDTEVYRLRESGAVSPFASFTHAVEERLLKTEGGGPAAPCRDWTVWGFGGSAESAVEDVIGDTAFYEAESLHPLHATLVARLRAAREANARVHAAERELAAAREELDQFKRDENRKFSKRSAGKTPAELEAYRARTLKRVGTRFAELTADVSAATEALKLARDHAAEVA